jgi:phosphoribosylformylglycinamidine synthase
MVGLLDDVNDKMTLDFKDEGDLIFLIGKSKDDINSSEYLQKIKGIEFSPPPDFDLDTEFLLQQKIAELMKLELILSAHDVSEGGLFTTLLESCFPRLHGFDVVAADYNIRKDAYWFGESQSRVVVSVSPGMVDEFKKILGNHPNEELGIVTSGSIQIDGLDWGNIHTWKERYEMAIENLLSGHDSEHALTIL